MALQRTTQLNSNDKDLREWSMIPKPIRDDLMVIFEQRYSIQFARNIFDSCLTLVYTNSVDG